VVGHHRHQAAAGGLGGDHPERLRQHARHHDQLGARHQLLQLGMIHGAGEDHALAGQRLQPGPVGAEPDHHQRGVRVPRRQPPPRIEQQVHTLLAQQLAKVEDERTDALEAIRGVGVRVPFRLRARPV
jgi:hypothetical protein